MEITDSDKDYNQTLTPQITYDPEGKPAFRSNLKCTENTGTRKTS